MNSILKKIIAGLLVFILLSAVMTYWYFRNEIDHMLGGNTQVVDSSQFKATTGDIAIINVNVLSEDSSFMRENLTVLIKDKIIFRISKAGDVPAGFKIMDGEGRYLIPGLIDSHVHLKKSKNDLLLYITNGVTQIGEMTGMSHHFEYIDEINNGAIGPGIYIASPKINSLDGWYPTVRSIFEQRHQNFITPESARQAVRNYSEKGYQAIKLSSDVNSDIYFALNDEAKKIGIPVIGHLPVGLTLDDLYRSGQSQLGHIDSIVHNLANEFGGISVRNSDAFLEHVNFEADAIAKKFKQNNISLASTVWLHKTIEQQMFELPEFLKSIELEYQNPGWLEGSLLSKGCFPGGNSYENRYSKTPASKRAAINYRETYNRAIEVTTKALRDNGVIILAGTDALGACGMIAGFSLHSELEALNNLGLSPSQVLKSATSVPAKWMGVKTGLIKKGYKADLLLLNKNPLIDISNTRTISVVIANGNYFDRSQLDQMLEQVKSANKMSREVSIDDYLN